MVFELSQTQWRIGMAGLTGLDYAAVIPVIALYTPLRAKQRETLELVRLLETGCLQVMAEQRKDKPT